MENKSKEVTKICKGSVIFRRNRVVGYVSNHIPANARYVQRRKDTIITTCIGRSFQVYTASHCRLIHISDVHPDEITAMAVNRVYTFTASNKCIFAWRAGQHLVHILRGHTRDIHILEPFGTHLISVDEANVLRVWDVSTEEVYLEIPFNEGEFQITALCHPPTYLNKIVMGSRQGQLKIWNIKENRLIFTFTGHDCKVTVIEPAPALDVVAVGYQDGLIVLQNLKFNEELMQFKQDWGTVTQISFRTDGPPIMTTSGTNGFIAFWNLEERKIAHQLQAHENSVTTTICFPNEPLILTTSTENSMKLWVCDMPDGGPRMLITREGHTAPPIFIRYHGADGETILSAGEDRSMMVFSTVSETLHRSMGKASYNRKASKKKKRFQVDDLRMPPIVRFTSETTREEQWDNIAAIHAGIIQTTTWSFHRNCMGEHRLVPEKFQNKNRTDFKTETTCVALTHCGNFVIIGYSSGDLERFNIQSGIHRATYGNPAHNTAIRGVSSDNLNQYVISGGSEGILKFWPFKSTGEDMKPFSEVEFDSGIALMEHHQESALIAVGLDNFIIKIVDTDTRSIIRHFEGHSAKINDMTFSPDNRWLISAAMDATIKVWDIPSAFMIDHFRTESVCVSLSMSPCGDFLATAHVNSLGIHLWWNKTLFGDVELRSINPKVEAPYIDLTQCAANVIDTGDTEIENAVEEMTINDSDDDNEFGEEVELKYKTVEQLAPDLITFSTLPSSRWENLLDLDAIKERNKPKAALKVPKQAPFFLPTVSGLEMKFDVNAAEAEKNSSKVIELKTLSNLTTFGKLLEETAKNENFQNCVEHLMKLGPSMIDFEIKSLHPINGGSVLVMIQFLKVIEFMLKSNKNFELAQSYLSVFVRAHGLNLLDLPEVMDELRSLSKLQEETWEKLEEKMLFCISVASALRNFLE